MMYENNVSPNINVTTYRFLNNQMVIQELKIISEMKKSLEGFKGRLEQQGERIFERRKCICSGVRVSVVYLCYCGGEVQGDWSLHSSGEDIMNICK